jgi:hypothetical protein
MADNRTKSVRMEENLHQTLKTLAGYLNKTMDEVIEEGAKRLWAETFPNVPMPGETAKPKKSSKRK